MQAEQVTPMDICITNAGNTAESFKLDVKPIQDKCECVKAKLGGVLPITPAEWGVKGKDSAKVALINCLQSEITAKFENHFHSELADDLEKRGFTNQRIKKYSLCSGAITYESVRRGYISTSNHDDEADRAWYKKAHKDCLDAGG